MEVTVLLRERVWSQTELATKCGISHEVIGEYERGEAVPSKNKMQAILK